RVDVLFAELKKRFDVIIIDTAPAGMVSDALTLGKFADCTLYLVRQGHTFKKQIALIDEFYRENKLPKLSIIINDVKVKPGYGYYGYGRYGYGYGYGYGSYYEEEHPPKSFLEKVIDKLDFTKFFKKEANVWCMLPAHLPMAITRVCLNRRIRSGSRYHLMPLQNWLMNCMQKYLASYMALNLSGFATLIFSDRSKIPKDLMRPLSHC